MKLISSVLSLKGPNSKGLLFTRPGIPQEKKTMGKLVNEFKEKPMTSGSILSFLSRLVSFYA